MDANGQVDPILEPHWRAYRACIAEAARALRCSVERGRPMSLPNLRRLFERRWHRVAARLVAADRVAVFAAGRERGRAWLAAYHPLNAAPSPAGDRLRSRGA